MYSLRRKKVFAKALMSVVLIAGIWYCKGLPAAAEEIQVPEEEPVPDPEIMLPAVKEIEISPAPNENGWIREDIEFTVTIASGEMPYLEYRKEDETEWAREEEAEASDDGCWVFTVMEEDEEYEGAYYFRAGDASGNVSEETAYSVKKDKVVPQADGILAEYVAYGKEGSPVQYPKGLFAKEDGLEDCIFGKEKIQVTLYFPDELSGVKTVRYEYGGTEGTAECLFTEEYDENYYSVVSFPIEAETEDTLKILSVADYAGNVAEHEDGSAVAEGAATLVIDRTAPEVQAEYPQWDGYSNEKGYCRPEDGEISETVRLTFTETYFQVQEDIFVYPGIAVYQNGVPIVPEDFVKWGEFSEGQVEAVICLPYLEGQEADYQIGAVCEDRSGNRLEWKGELTLDDRAPELTAFSVTGESDRKTVDGIPVYQQGCVKILFSVDEREADWNPDRVSMTVSHRASGTPAAYVRGEDLDWSTEGQVHQAEYVFESQAESVPSEYVAELSYLDPAGAALSLSEGNLEELKAAGDLNGSGAYVSKAFILDEKEPVLKVAYTRAERLVLDENIGREYDLQEQEPKEGYTAYYDGNITVSFTLEEDYALPVRNGGEMTGLGDYELSVLEKSGAACSPDIEWNQEGNRYEGTFTLEEEGSYVVSMKYRDAAANQAAYESPVLVLDRTPPRIHLSYADLSMEEVSSEEGFFSRPVYLKIQVEDEHVRSRELLDVLKGAKAADSRGREIQEHALGKFLEDADPAWMDEEGLTWYLPLLTEANYEITAGCEDLAGNRSEYISVKNTVDLTEPKISLTWSTEPAGFLDAVNYRDLGYLFADRKMTLSVTAEDMTSGIRRVCFFITDEEGNMEEKEYLSEPSFQEAHEITVPVGGQDFRGSIRVEVYDWSGNMGSREHGHVVESEERHRNSGKIEIETLTEPGRTVDGTAYYNTDIDLRLRLRDEWSGIRSYAYLGGHTLSGSADYAKEAGNDLEEEPREDAVWEYSERMTLSAAANNENNVQVYAEYTDNAGHMEQIVQYYNIDVTAPEIMVEYDRNEPADGRFYNRTRTATVTVKERNFRPEDVEFHITSTDGVMPEISGWTSSGEGDNMIHVCTVTFFADGDYTFTAGFQDLAGNRADYSRVDEFTIDQSEPVLTVTYDNNESSNGYYYSESRRAVLEIQEHNFAPEQFQVYVTADGTPISGISAWNSEGDRHTATVLFENDAEYTLEVSGADQAGNSLEVYGADHFVIDRTPPVLEIRQVSHHSANQGEVAPFIQAKDKNLDFERFDISLEGYRNLEQEIKGDRGRNTDGMWIQMEDFPYTPETDDLYTLRATASDLAGNRSETIVAFSVNRFGSVYTLEGWTDAYYINEAQDIRITETNVDTLEFREITCNWNGNLKTLAEGEDYTVRESGSAETWKQYEYVISRSNFEKEGIYAVTVYSEDRAENVSDNQSKGMTLAFAVDRTSPSVLISGVEDRGKYRENSREITIDIQDNICLAETAVVLDGEKKVFSASEVESRDGILIITAPARNGWQTLRVTARDEAGNEFVSDEMRFLVTSDILIQFFMNKPLLLGTAGGILALTACIWLILAKRNGGSM